MAGELLIIGTPLGNLADISRRVTETFAHLDVLFCEDTRVTGKLIAALGLSVSLRALSDDHGPERVQEAVQAVLGGKRVGYCADAGMPGVSDPGRRLVQEAWRAGIEPKVVPGPSAVATWLSACPFIDNGFTFAGFAPRKAGDRDQFIDGIVHSPLPTVFFESPRRIHDLLDSLCTTLEPNRQVLLGREMTKLFEQFILFKAGQWDVKRSAVPEQGEFTVGVASAPFTEQEIDREEVMAALHRLRQAGFSAKDSAKALAAVRGLRVNDIKQIGFRVEELSDA